MAMLIVLVLYVGLILFFMIHSLVNIKLSSANNIEDTSQTYFFYFGCVKTQIITCKGACLISILFYVIFNKNQRPVSTENVVCPTVPRVPEYPSLPYICISYEHIQVICLIVLKELHYKPTSNVKQ